MYENEAAVGAGIIRSGIDRNEIFLTTKINTGVMREGEEAVRRSINGSLENERSGDVPVVI